jgi:exodeoxyribonuclease V beta subunit
VVFHDEDRAHARTLDVGVSEPLASYRAHLQMARREQRGEDLRLLYVALSRARHQAVIWWVRAYESEHSSLGRVLMFRDPAGEVPPSGRYAPRDGDVERRLSEVAAGVPGHISVERCSAYTARRWRKASPGPLPLAVASFPRRLDLSWRRTSYTGITTFGRPAEAVGSEPEEPGTTDEPLGTGGFLPASPADPAADDRLRAVRCILSDTPGGSEVGTFVHRVLEQVDFAAADLGDAVRTAIVAVQARRLINIGDSDVLAAGLAAAICTPLGPLAGGRSLRQVARRDRIDELRFELPLAGGDHPGGEVLMADIAALVARHTPAGSVLGGYGSRLATLDLSGPLRGYLTGSLDVVLRVGGDGGPPRFLVVDYKTNWLAPEGQQLTAWHYRRAALDAEMQRAHYPLQALLYLVALHRYLRWRLAGYDPGTHLGGVIYTFLRGMLGPQTPTVGPEPAGVFGWRPAAALVTELSDLLDTSRDAG